MTTSKQRYQRLEALSIEQCICIALAALRFFQPLSHEQNCKKLGIEPKSNSTFPFCGFHFLKFLSLPNELPQQLLPEPMRHMQRIDDLLQRLARGGLLQDVGHRGASPMNRFYYAMYEATLLERQGCLYLARALGAPFIHQAYKSGTYQITGVTRSNDLRAGTGIAISPRWLLTCAHVITDMTVDDQQVTPGRAFNVVSRLTHSTIDVGLLEVDRDLPVVLGLNFRNPYVGERVYTLGYPRVPLSRQAALVMQGGEVSAENVTTLHGDELFLFSAIARPGNSGGPILSDEGHVVGIVTQELSEQDSPIQPFHAGIATSTLARAIEHLNCGVSLPVETWQ